uniref:Uncharacterized protein n=1 Tax=Heterorhabditis bacteriophora TaxID=37862 RepID=A0A1I7X8A0_HETBA
MLIIESDDVHSAIFCSLVFSCVPNAYYKLSTVSICLFSG